MGDPRRNARQQGSRQLQPQRVLWTWSRENRSPPRSPSQAASPERLAPQAPEKARAPPPSSPPQPPSQLPAASGSGRAAAHGPTTVAEPITVPVTFALAEPVSSSGGRKLHNSAGRIRQPTCGDLHVTQLVRKRAPAWRGPFFIALCIFGDQKSMSPPPGIAGMLLFSGSSATIASVVRKSPAIEAAF